MKAFWKDNSYIIVKLLLNQFAMIIFAAMLAFFYNYRTIYVLSSVFSILLYLFLIATVVYEIGAKDYIRIEAGRMKAQPWRGFWIGVCSGAINLILGLAVYITHLLAAPGNPAEAAHELCTLIAKVCQAMYLGLINTFQLSDFYYLIIPLPAIFVCTVVYWLAQKGKLVIRPRKKEE